MSFMVKRRDKIRNIKSGSDGRFYLKQGDITHHSIPQIITRFVNSAHHPVLQINENWICLHIQMKKSMTDIISF
jgi:hypothetical protein